MQEVKTFVRRKQNRMTPAQKKALTAADLSYLRVDIEQIVNSEQAVILDIGFGMGDSLLSLAESYPNNLVIGIDIYQPGIARALALASARGITNLKVYDGDALEVLHELPDGILAGVQLLFPDPWPKKRHFKRRFVQLERLQLLCRKLVSGGWFRLVTDCDSYAEHAYSCINQSDFDCVAASYGSKVMTKYWQRAIRLGHNIHEYCCVS